MERTFGDWLRKRRETVGLTGAEVARRSGVTPAYISLLEKNRTSRNGTLTAPSIDKTDAIARAIGVHSSEARLAAG